MKRSWNFKDLTGQKFGRLTVLRLSHRSGTNNCWHCVCSCGKSLIVRGNHLTSDKHQQSCGCLSLEKRRNTLTTHGEATGEKVSVEYAAFQAAKSRCACPTNQNYRHYGGRGIQFRFTTVAELVACIGRRPSPKHSLDRINNNGHYEAGNVRWATQLEQQNNRRPPRRRKRMEVNR
jgi:hypothetical protein